MEPSRRDYFAAHAPETIPVWFEPEGLPKPKLPDPDPELNPYVVEILANPNYHFELATDGTLRTQSNRFIAKHKVDLLIAFRNSRQVYFKEYASHRYFAWRWYYAETMIAKAKALAMCT